MPEHDLLRRYIQERSDEAFSALVKAHIDLVYSSALRQSRDAELAEDITQAVFIALAHKAPELAPGTVLSSWLLTTTRHAVSNARRMRENRKRFEARAAAMNSNLSAHQERDWQDLLPHLDAALASLEAPDHDALVLRFFERRSLENVGEALGVTANAADKRISRALEKMRRFFARRGVTLSAASLAAIVTENAVQSAPAAAVVKACAGMSVGAQAPNALLAESVLKAAPAGVTFLESLVGVAIVALVASLIFGIVVGIQRNNRLAESRRLAALNNPPVAPQVPVNGVQAKAAIAVENFVIPRLEGWVIYDGPPPAPKIIRPPELTVPLVDESLLVDPTGRHGIQWAVLRVMDVNDISSPPPAAAPMLNLKGFQFVPHALIVAPATPLTVNNLDVAVHNFHSVPLDFVNNELNHAVPPAASFGAKSFGVPYFAQPEIIQGKDDIYPWMKCLIVVHDPRYCAITDANGRFSIPALPAGKYKLNVYHERIGERTIDLVIDPNAPPSNGTVLKIGPAK